MLSGQKGTPYQELRRSDYYSCQSTRLSFYPPGSTTGLYEQ